MEERPDQLLNLFVVGSIVQKVSLLLVVQVQEIPDCIAGALMQLARGLVVHDCVEVKLVAEDVATDLGFLIRKNASVHEHLIGDLLSLLSIDSSCSTGVSVNHFTV